jgi:hypothetical protein
MAEGGAAAHRYVRRESDHVVSRQQAIAAALLDRVAVGFVFTRLGRIEYVAKDVMRALVIEEKNLQLVRERIEATLVERNDRHAIDNPRVRDITQIIHVD